MGIQCFYHPLWDRLTGDGDVYTARMVVVLYHWQGRANALDGVIVPGL